MPLIVTMQAFTAAGATFGYMDYFNVILGKYTFPADMTAIKIGEIGDAVSPFIELGPNDAGTSPFKLIQFCIYSLALNYLILAIIAAAIPKKRKEKVA